MHTIGHFVRRNSQVADLRGRPGPAGVRGRVVAPPPLGCDSIKAVISPNLYLIVVPLIRRNGQPMFSRRSCCKVFTLQPRMAAYTCSSTHAHGTEGTRVRSTGRRALLISPPRCAFAVGATTSRFAICPGADALGVRKEGMHPDTNQIPRFLMKPISPVQCWNRLSVDRRPPPLGS